MKLSFKNLFTSIFALAVFLYMSSSCEAASLSVDAPSKATTSALPIVVRVTVDTEGDILSGISGNFSFPSYLFDIQDISYEGSVVSLWATPPLISKEKYLDGRTHIPFEGIFPGGYKGVISPYYQGEKPGLVFSITLIPKEKGIGTFVIDESSFNAFDADAHTLPGQTIVTTIEVPELLKKNRQVYSNNFSEQQIIKDPSFIFITQDDLINNGAWYMSLHDDQAKSAIAKIMVAETDTYSSSNVSEGLWRTVNIPHVLLHQKRDVYIHVKVFYQNGTFSINTIAPVENSPHISSISRILIGIAIVLLFHFYGKQSILSSFKYFSKKS